MNQSIVCTVVILHLVVRGFYRNIFFCCANAQQSRDTTMTCVINEDNNFLLRPNTKLMFPIVSHSCLQYE